MAFNAAILLKIREYHGTWFVDDLASVLWVVFFT